MNPLLLDLSENQIGELWVATLLAEQSKQAR